MAAVQNSLDLLFPPVREAVEKVLTIVEPYHFEVFESLRDLDRQLEVWKKGRELQNGVWVVVDPKQVATKAQPGATMHNYGLAVDIIPRLQSPNPKLGLQWSWEDYDLTQDGNQKIPWDILIKAYQRYGMDAGGTWKTFCDRPHGELTYGFKCSELYPILISEGLVSVWKLVMTRASAGRVSVPVNEIPAIPIPPNMTQPQTRVSNPTSQELDSKYDGDRKITWFDQLLKIILSLFKK